MKTSFWISSVAALVATVSIAHGDAAAASGPLAHLHRTVTQLIASINGAEPQRRSISLELLRTTPPSSTDEITLLVQNIHTGDNSMKEAGIESLSLIPSARSDLKDSGIALLDDKDPKVQLAGVRLAESWNTVEIRSRLRGMLLKAPRFKIAKDNSGRPPFDVWELHMELAAALAKFKDAESVDEILSREEIMSVRGGGIALAQFGAQVLPEVLGAARQNGARREGALAAVANMRDEAAIPLLVLILDDEDTQLAAAASRAIFSITPSSPENRSLIAAARTKALNSSNEYVRMHAQENNFTGSGPDAPAITLETLMKEKGVARNHIIYALMQNGRKDAVPVLKEFIKKDEQEHPSRYATTSRKIAAQAIFRLTGEKVPYLGVEEDQKLYADPYSPQKR